MYKIHIENTYIKKIYKNIKYIYIHILYFLYFFYRTHMLNIN